MIVDTQETFRIETARNALQHQTYSRYNINTESKYEYMLVQSNTNTNTHALGNKTPS